MQTKLYPLQWDLNIWIKLWKCGHLDFGTTVGPVAEDRVSSIPLIRVKHINIILSVDWMGPKSNDTAINIFIVKSLPKTKAPSTFHVDPCDDWFFFGEWVNRWSGYCRLVIDPRWRQLRCVLKWSFINIISFIQSFFFLSLFPLRAITCDPVVLISAG